MSAARAPSALILHSIPLFLPFSRYLQKDSVSSSLMVLPRRPRYSARHAIGLSRLDRADPPLIIVSSPVSEQKGRRDGGTGR